MYSRCIRNIRDKLNQSSDFGLKVASSAWSGLLVPVGPCVMYELCTVL